MRGLVYIFIVLSLMKITGLGAQDSLRIGDSFDYLPYQVFKHHIETPDHFYSTADIGIVKWDKNDLSYELLSKVDGLSDIEPEHIVYDKATDAVIIAYANSNIDILYPYNTLNVRDIHTSEKIIGRKEINKLLTEDETLYVVGSYGVSIYDLRKSEFVLTIFTDKPTIDFNLTEDRYFLSTTGGYYTYDRNGDQTFLVTLAEWDTLNQEDNLPMEITYGKIGINNSCVVLQDGLNLYIASLSDLQFTILTRLEQNSLIPFMKTDKGEIQIGIRNPDIPDYVLKVGESCTITDTLHSPCFNYLTGYLETSTGIVLVGDGFLGFHYIDKNGACKIKELPGPEGKQAYSLTFRNDTLYVTNGGVDKLNYRPQRMNHGFSYFDGEKWHRYSSLSYNPFRWRGYVDIVQAIPSPDGKKVYLNSALTGLAVFDFNNFTFYDEENSCLETVSGADETVRLPAMVMDDEGNLWISNYFADHGLIFLGADGTCKAIEIPVRSQLGEMIIDENGVLWAAMTGNIGGILTYNPKTQEFHIISSSNSVLSGEVRTLALDKDGAVWVGATNGAYVFYHPQGQGFRPPVDSNQDGIGDYLLMDQFVTAIGIDGANRKWFGTRNGVIVQSPNGLINELRLTTENCPLPANTILDFAFDNEKGIVYIGTSKGVLGIKIKATGGTPFHKKNIYAYPNPVRPDYTGPIAIKGLAENAHVKIVDQQGYLVKELQAYGGQAIWDGTNLNNQKVASGIYLVFSTAPSYNSQRKPDAATTKILVIR